MLGGAGAAWLTGTCGVVGISAAFAGHPEFHWAHFISGSLQPRWMKQPLTIRLKRGRHSPSRTSVARETLPPEIHFHGGRLKAVLH
jgi:hypothetical protein